MTIEFYIDLTQIPRGYDLIHIDDENRRWSVTRSLQREIKTQGDIDMPLKLIYERWTIELDARSSSVDTSGKDPPPNLYKKGVILMRSLYTYLRFLPAWKFTRRLSQKTGLDVLLKPKFDIIKGTVGSNNDTLDWPIVDEEEEAVTEEYRFQPLPCTLGTIHLSTKYRANCNFELEAIGGSSTIQTTMTNESVGSSERLADSSSDYIPQDSPRHRNRAKLGSGGEGVESRVVTGSRSSLKSTDPIPVGSFPRRTSLSFQPFKAGSLSSSPATGPLAASPGGSYGRTIGAIPTSHSRSRTSLNTLPQQALRNPSTASEPTNIPHSASSPKPASIQRYSSSFSNRRARFPSSYNTKADEDGSSSRGSDMSAQRTSVTALDQETMYHDDSESIGDFLKMLDRSSRDLDTFPKSDAASVAANSHRTALQYSKFAKMKDSTSQLSESISSSLILPKSSFQSLRQPINNALTTSVNPPLAGTSSLSSTPSPSHKPVSPHAPHTPAVPSRLSNNTPASYNSDLSNNGSRTIRASDRFTSSTNPTDLESTPLASRRISEESRVARAIDIPSSSSPRVYINPLRPSPSVYDRTRTAPMSFASRSRVDNDDLDYGQRASSMPSEKRPKSRPRLERRTSSGIRTEHVYGVNDHNHSEGSNHEDDNDHDDDDDQDVSGNVIDDDDDDDEPLLFDLGELGKDSIR